MKTTREVKREEHNERPQWKCDLAILMGKLVGRRDVEFDLPLEQFIEHLLEKEREGYLTSKGNAEMSRDARARLGLTQIEMAKRLGISTIQLAKVEGGDRGFSKKVLIKLSILKGKK